MLKAIGSLGSKKHVKLIWMNSLLWFQRFLRNIKIQLCSKDMTNSISGSLDFHIGNIGVIFGVFFTKICNIDIETTKIVTKMQNMGKITKKLLI